MGIARDTQVSARQDTGTTNTKSMTVTGQNLYMLTFPAWRGGQTVSSVKYKDINLTRLAGAIWSVGGGAVDLWALKNPPIGTDNLVTVLSGTPTGGFAVGAMTYTGVNSIGAIATDNTDEKPMDVDILTTGKDSWVCVSGVMRDPLVVTEESPTVEHWNVVSVISTHWTCVGGDIPGPLAIGTHTPSWTYTQVTIQTAIIAVELIAINRLKQINAGVAEKLMATGVPVNEVDY